MLNLDRVFSGFEFHAKQIRWISLVSLLLRNSCLQMLFKKCILKNFANFTWKHLCCGLFLITLQALCWSLFWIKFQAWRPATLLKRDSTTDASLWNLRNFTTTLQQNLTTTFFLEHLRWLVLIVECTVFYQKLV